MYDGCQYSVLFDYKKRKDGCSMSKLSSTDYKKVIEIKNKKGILLCENEKEGYRIVYYHFSG